ncbi:PA14 domain-containing protein [Piscinibacter sp.]|uniref:PA14 domain-containing protein n=1 Tax=Piscinibacter sp. TaxID=1903157 RepID=UPI0039E41903
MPTTPRLRLASLTFAALLAACGGGGDDTPSSSDAQAVEGRKTSAAFTPTTPIPSDAHQRGMWGPVKSWPLIPVHAVLMPDGRVMSYGTDGSGRQTGFFLYDVWDPTVGPDGSHLTLPNGTGTDIFCGSQLVLPGGDAVFLAGGDNWTGSGTTNTGNNNSNLFKLADNSLTRGTNMNRARWYSSSTMLLNGEAYIQGGTGGTDRPEVRQADGTFRLLSGANTGGYDYMYPRNFIAPDGRVFGYDSAGRMYYVDPNGTGSVTSAGQFPSSYAGSDSSTAMFRPGRILQFGGNSNGAIVIDIRGGAPVVTPTAAMSSQRRLVTAAVLPDGKVLATGGSRTWNVLDQVNNSAEIWNPDTGTWTVGPSGVQARLYHSMSLLLPDGTVMVGGGGAPGPQNNLNYELYFPPYLFAPGGQLAARPVIDAAPTVMDIGRTYTVDVSGAGPAARVVLIKHGSVTHSWNMEQRYVELTFAASGNRLAVQAPTHAADAPPGFYMMFVLDANGVPSVAKTVRINVAEQPNPEIVPVVGAIADRNGTVGTTVLLQVVASDPNGDVLRYTATGLPPGLAIDPQTGLISGTPSAAGSYYVVVAASDGVNSSSTAFTWTIGGSAVPLTVSFGSTPSAAVSGSSANFTASATGNNLRYKWNFGDGSAETDWSSSPTASHDYTQPGLYTVTVTVTDDSGLEVRSSTLQAIYLPPTAGTPVGSTPIAFEARSGANPRLWVLNPDNDSVSVFDAATRARLAEIPVGAGPRTLALTGNGTVWVTNKFGASISVIDAASLAVSRTIALPRGSQPFGVVASAGGNAFVVLEAGGTLLKFNTASYAQTGSLAIGMNARHVALSADGANAYVSRFISAPVAGESTATPGAGGGEVLQVATAAMTLARRITLAQSTRPDAENQGRGLPNYLGAAAISPDGVTAWVPSKLDNISRGIGRDGLPLNFQNTVRSVSSRIVLASGSEDLDGRLDHDNASMASAAVFDARGLYLFVALETSREVAVIDAHGRREMFRFDTGLAPQGLALSADGLTLYVHNFMDRSVGVHDLRPLMQQGLLAANPVATLATITTEKLTPTVLRGKQLFYDARDPRLARDRYMSCASCHNDGGEDGRVWDLTGFGEGLRNTISLRGRGGMGQGFLHWSNNFDEVQDFEGQIRALAGGTGLMSESDFAAGTRSQPLGDRKAGVSADLDALAAYLGSLTSFAPAPARPGATTLSAAAAEGKAIFAARNCASCHSGAAFSGSGANTLVNIGTLKPTSGRRLDAALTGLDVPTLRDAWATAPYLHDGSAATLEAAVRAHDGVTITDADLAKLTAYLREIGGDEPAAVPAAGTGAGLRAEYFNNITVTGTPALTRTEAIDFNWGNGAPGTGVGADNFSVRWSGKLIVPANGTYRFQTESDDGVRVTVNGVRLVDNWTDHSPTVNTSAGINLTAGTQVDIVAEYYERGGGAVMRLRWLTPGDTAFVAVPAKQLLAPAVVTGSGLAGSYFNNITLSGSPVLSRVQAVDFDWGTGSPGTGVGANNFSARWSGTLLAPASGSYRFRTVSDDGVRVWVNGTQLINNWSDHSATTNTSAAISLVAGQRYTVRVEYYEKGGSAVMRLRWQRPGNSSYVAIPAASLFPN